MLPDAGPDKRCYRVDCSKIRRVLPIFEAAFGTPDWALETAVTRIGRIGLTVDEFEGVRYKRIAHIQATDGRRDLPTNPCAGTTGHPVPQRSPTAVGARYMTLSRFQMPGLSVRPLREPILSFRHDTRSPTLS